MRILFDATALALTGYHKGGAYRYGVELLRHLPGPLAEFDSETELKLYFNFFRRHHLPRMEETVALAGHPPYVFSRIHPKLLRAMRAPVEWTGGNHDVFHGPFDRIPPSRRSARVVTIHDLAFLRSPEGLPADWVAELNATVPVSARRAHRVITVSEFSRMDIVNRLGIDPERVEAIYHGIPEGLKPPADPEADLKRLKERYDIDPGYLLYLGTLQPNKNIEGLCSAFQRLRKDGFSGQLVLAGSKGWLYQEMWQRIVARGEDLGVLQTGFVDEEDIPRLYGNCAAFCLVSFLEGFGIPVIEAMACGAPVVAADACSLPEVGGEAAILVQPRDPEAIADGILKAATPGPERDALVQAGLARAATFTWESSAKAHLKAYKRAMESR
ncbi:MAG: glycosyltransferase family 1 protein [Planctomycetota bacterium]|nr:MAG: glycosyltransferase family 1 protein [Planctomycetota bacterium]